MNSPFGLNFNLMPEDSPIAKNQGQTSSFQFDYENEAGIVSNTKIRNAAITNAKIGTAAIGTANIGTLSFNEIHGGTATLGGTTNGNGLLEVLNSAGGTITTINNQGIRVTGGSIIIANDAGGTIIDSTGLKSTTNFIYGQIADFSSLGTTASSSYVDVSGGALSPFVLSRPANIFVGMFVQALNSDVYSSLGTAYANFQVFDSDTSESEFSVGVSGNVITNLDSGTAIVITGEDVSFSAFVQFATGQHTLKLRFRAANSGTAYLAEWVLFYIIYGS